MIIVLPEPLTPARCILRSRAMPIDLDGIRRMRSFNCADDAAARAGFSLLCAAWTQSPAGSLCNEDAALRHWAGLGYFHRRWRRVREVALADFVLCSDGRLYSPLLARAATEQWIADLLKRGRSALMRGAPIGGIGSDLATAASTLGQGSEAAQRAWRWLAKHEHRVFEIPATSSLQPTSEALQ